jgi:uncharacterized protein (PEP-CTERM system associated)
MSTRKEGRTSALAAWRDGAVSRVAGVAVTLIACGVGSYSASAQDSQPSSTLIPPAPQLAPLLPAPLLPPRPLTPAPVLAPSLTGPFTMLPPGLALPNVLPPMVAPPLQPLPPGRAAQAPERTIGAGQGYLIDGWLIAPSVDLRQSFTDNAFETSRPRRSDAYTTIAPAVTVSRQGANNQVYLNYDFQADKYWNNDGLDRIQHDLTEFSHSGLIRDWLFFDTDAVIRQEPLTPFASFTINPSTQRFNTTQEIGLSASPYLRHRFGSFAESELRYSYGQVNYDTTGLVDTRTNEVSWNTVSGDDFTQLRWTTQFAYSDTQRSGKFLQVGPNLSFIANPSGDAITEVGQANLEYIVVRGVGLLFGGGYESIQDPTLSHNIRDATWNVGFHLRPGPRTDLRVLYGRQYGATVFTGAGQYELSPATKFTAQLINDIETSSSILQQNLLGLGVDEFGNAVVGADQQLLDNNSNTLLGISQAAFRRRRAEIDMRSEFGRNVINPQIYYERRRTDLTNSVETATGITVYYTRDLAPDLVGTASLNYRHVNYSFPSARENDYFGSLGLIYQLSKATSTYGSYSHLTRNSNSPSGDLEENLFVIGVRRYF